MCLHVCLGTCTLMRLPSFSSGVTLQGLHLLYLFSSPSDCPSGAERWEDRQAPPGTPTASYTLREHMPCGPQFTHLFNEDKMAEQRGSLGAFFLP